MRFWRKSPAAVFSRISMAAAAKMERPNSFFLKKTFRFMKAPRGMTMDFRPVHKERRAPPWLPPRHRDSDTRLLYRLCLLKSCPGQLLGRPRKQASPGQPRPNQANKKPPLRGAYLWENCTSRCNFCGSLSWGLKRETAPKPQCFPEVIRPPSKRAFETFASPETRALP